MKKYLLTLAYLAFAIYSTESSAQIFRLRVTDYGAGAGNATFENFVNTEIQKIENDINKDLPSAPPQRLMEGMANSSVMAGKGIGSDYASNMQVFLLGAGVGVGADLEKDDSTDSDISGVGIAPGVIIGANLGFLNTSRILGMDTNRLNLYLNFMSYSHKQTIDDDPGKESDAELDMTAMGIHFRYDWIKGSGSKLFGWGGVKFHFGYEYNKTDITFNSSISETVTETSSGGETISGTITGSPSATILVNTHSIPLEISTDVQLLYILSLYGGLGADYSFGQAKGNGSLNASESPITCTGGACGGGTTVQVKPEANIDATGKVDPFTFRGFAGVQINLPYIRIFGQVDKSLGSEVIGATAGVRLVY
ncbi:MAG: Lsa36 family surface (lipo)protein [Bacteriovoracia bacterium]